jgi:hemerythrin-like domain-containing protein
MPTRNQVLAALEGGGAYEDAARALGIHPGQAFLIATGWAVDGSDVPAPEERQRPGSRSESTQALSNPASECPVRYPGVAQWMARRAAVDVQMRNAAAQFQPQPAVPHDAGEVEGGAEEADQLEHWDVVALLRRQHNLMRKALKQLEAIPGPKDGVNERDIARRAELIEILASDMPRHEEAEEEYLWPAVRDSIDGGLALADHAVKQEHEAANLLRHLVKLAPDNESAITAIESLVSAVRRHVALEDKVFLRLERALGQEDRVALGRQLVATEAKGPSRPRRRLPSDPAFLHAVRPVAAAADRVSSKTSTKAKASPKEKGQKQ